MRLELVAVCVALVACRSKSTDGSPAEATSEYRGIATANAPSTEDPKLHVARKVDAGPRTGRSALATNDEADLGPAKQSKAVGREGRVQPEMFDAVIDLVLQHDDTKPRAHG
mgnify:CR=1 FL=1